MSIRKTLFGYEIRDGRIAANDREADVVRRIFKLYRNGESYKSVADALNREGVPYSGDAPQWDKCKVKRTLENPRYAGWDGYPSIITKEDFQGVQAVIRTKSSGSKQLTMFESSSPLFDVQKHDTHGKLFTLTRDTDGSGNIDTDDIEFSGYLEGDGDFRSKEVCALRDESDIIITNPPFSLFRPAACQMISRKVETLR